MGYGEMTLFSAMNTDAVLNNSPHVTVIVRVFHNNGNSYRGVCPVPMLILLIQQFFLGGSNAFSW